MAKNGGQLPGLRVACRQQPARNGSPPPHNPKELNSAKNDVSLEASLSMTTQACLTPFLHPC